MTAPKRRIALTRKVSLADYADDWDDCYAVVTLATFEEVTDIQAKAEALKKGDDLAAVKFMAELAKSHFVAGKIRILDAEGQAELVDMRASDIMASTKIINGLYLAVMGVTLDPKSYTDADGTVIDDAGYSGALERREHYEDFIVHRIKPTDPAIAREIKLHHYADRRNISYNEAIQEPNEAIEHAFLIWSLEDSRAKLKTAQQHH